ncbi:hypothetical protein V8943_18290, partial [Acinetobacter baumannii]
MVTAPVALAAGNVPRQHYELAPVETRCRLTQLNDLADRLMPERDRPLEWRGASQNHDIEIAGGRRDG